MYALQPVHPCSLIKVYTVHSQKLQSQHITLATSVDFDLLPECAGSSHICQLAEFCLEETTFDILDANP